MSFAGHQSGHGKQQKILLRHAHFGPETARLGVLKACSIYPVRNDRDGGWRGALFRKMLTRPVAHRNVASDTAPPPSVQQSGEPIDGLGNKEVVSMSMGHHSRSGQCSHQRRIFMLH